MMAINKLTHPEEGITISKMHGMNGSVSPLLQNTFTFIRQDLFIVIFRLTMACQGETPSTRKRRVRYIERGQAEQLRLRAEYLKEHWSGGLGSFTSITNSELAKIT
ncbi:hypothetical protein WG66_013257 [Moniliophthora roreri]|nr:hypothetical protein WG66_013257 [Moniliophthora roreri]